MAWLMWCGCRDRVSYLTNYEKAWLTQGSKPSNALSAQPRRSDDRVPGTLPSVDTLDHSGHARPPFQAGLCILLAAHGPRHCDWRTAARI
jgi:hypothetical protein